MAKSKYKPRSFPLKVERLARDGFSDKQIYEQLGIKKDSFYLYLKKYPAFSEAYERGREPVNIKVENALLRRCIGEEYAEKSVEQRKLPDGSTIEVKKVTYKQVLPHVGACNHWLQSKDPAWKKNSDEDNGGFETFSDLMLAYAEHEKKEEEGYNE